MYETMSNYQRFPKWFGMWIIHNWTTAKAHQNKQWCSEFNLHLALHLTLNHWEKSRHKGLGEEQNQWQVINVTTNNSSHKKCCIKTVCGMLQLGCQIVFPYTKRGKSLLCELVLHEYITTGVESRMSNADDALLCDLLANSLQLEKHHMTDCTVPNMLVMLFPWRHQSISTGHLEVSKETAC